MNKKNLLVLLALLTSLVLSMKAEAVNLLPPIDPTTQSGWTNVRNAAAQAEFLYGKIDEEDAFKIRILSDSGYAFYRANLPAVSGDYSFSLIVQGRSANGGIFEVYGFDEENKPQLLMMRHSSAGTVEKEILQGHFKVPEGCRSLRIGVGLSGNGELLFASPFLAPGKIEFAAMAGAEEGLAIAKEWKAQWLWLEKDPGHPRILFRKSFSLPARPEFASVQLTADNGYTLLVNGRVVGSDVDWRTVEKFDLVPFLQEGNNEICLDVLNFDGAGGVIMQSFVLVSGKQMIEILTDSSWTASLPDGQEVALKTGRPPVEPWFQIPFQAIFPPRQLRLELSEQTRELVAGETIRLSFKTDHPFTAEALSELKLQCFSVNGRETPLSAFPLIIRQEEKLKQLLVELPTSLYAAPGIYTWRLSGNTWDLFPISGETNLLLKSPEDASALSGSPFPKPGSNQMTTAGGSQSLFTYATSTPKLDSFQNWQRTGGHMFELSIPSGQWLSNGTFVTIQTEAQMLQILEGYPSAGIYLKFRIDVPGWWASRYPKDLFRSNKGRSALQSFCSLKWREDALTAIKAAVEELLQRPVGKALKGVLIMGFRGGEFQLWGEDVGEYDCSPVAVQEFARYQSEREIQPAVQLPHPALEYPFQEQNPEARRVREIYFHFLAERHADNLIHFAKEFKKTYGERLAFGVYFGYGMEYGGSLKRMLFAGHLGIAKILQEAPLDLLSAPFSYGLRGWQQTHAFMNPIDSARLHQILPMGENDVRNYRTTYIGDSSGKTILSFADSVLDNRRMRLLAAGHGAAVRYLALLDGIDFFSDPAMLRSIQQDNELVQQLRPEKLGAPQQVALVTDQLSWCRATAIPDSKLKAFISHNRDLLQRTGRGVAFITMEDYLEHWQLWQTLVIPFPGLLDEKNQEELEKRLGTLPSSQMDSGALVVCDGKLQIVDQVSEIWEILALPEARTGGKKTCWYIGENFRASWDGRDLQLQILD